MKAWDRLKQLIGMGVYDPSKGGSSPPSGGYFIPPDGWAKEMIRDFSKELNIAGRMMSSSPEPVCPLTKQLIAQTLADLAVKHPNTSLREIISVALEDGVADDHELLEKLTKLETALPKKPAGFKIMVGRRERDDRQDAMTYAMRGLLDNVALAKHARLVGCEHPEDTTGSSGEQSPAS